MCNEIKIVVVVAEMIACSLHIFFILAMNINGKLLVLKLSMKYNGPREWASLSTVHAVLREEADFLFRKETEESPLNADLNSSMETRFICKIS